MYNSFLEFTNIRQLSKLVNENKVACILFIVALVKSSYFSHFGFSLLDEGESLQNALRILEGNLPYRDFFAIFPPGDNYFFAGVFFLFGKSVIGPRLAESFIFAFVPVFIYKMGKNIMPDRYSLLIPLLIIFIGLSIERLYFFVPLLAGVTLFFKYIFLKNRSPLFLAGTLIALSALIRADIPGVYVIAISLGSLLHLIYTKNNDYKVWLYNMIFFGTGVLLPISLVGVWLYNNSIFNEFLFSTTVKPVEITKLHDLPFPSPTDMIPVDFSLARLYESYTAFLIYFILGIGVITCIRIVIQWKKAWQSEWKVGALALAGALALPYILGRTDIGHLTKGALPFLILFGYWIFRCRETKFLNRLCIAVYLVIFVASVAQCVWWLHFNNSALVISNYKLHLNSNYQPNSTLVSGQTLLKATEFVKSNSKQNEPVLLVPYMAGLYFLVDRPPIGIYNNILNGYMTPEEEKLFVEQLKVIRVVVYDPVNGPKMKQKLLSEYNPLIHNYIMSNFAVINETPEGWLFMKRE